jgi:hypothetical protein
VLFPVPASAQPTRPPLPPEEQAQVNVAIDRGVAFLMASQNPWGTWGVGGEPGPGGGHMIGFTALPGLTLLECGVPADHHSVQKAAAIVRASAPKIDTTYELALSILFLDRLGDPRDESLIETFALKLIAGQRPSGGWSYRCPSLTAATQRQLVTVLRQLNPGAGMILLPGELTLVKPSDKDPKFLGRLKMVDPGPVERGLAKPGGRGHNDLARVRPSDKALDGLAIMKTMTRSSGMSGLARIGEAQSRGPSSGSQWEPNYRYGETAAPETPDRPAPRPGQCIKMAEAPPAPEAPKGEGRPAGDKGNAKDKGKNDAPKGAEGQPPPKVVIPANLAQIPVLLDARRQDGWVDPKTDSEVPIMGKTDNSNTQFAILALWAAQRHGVPTERTLDKVVRRFRGSQNANGGWGYNYTPGGKGGSTPAMTCVGLIGLAVGHGLAHDGRPADGAPEKDPLLVRAFVTLSDFVGDPAGRTVNVPMTNLYFLWSLERVAVLYNLRKIGNKDWYRWGAEMLVANQGPHGNWDKGGYHGAQPILDTCLALLFLRRANLAADLTTRLPFNPEQLNTDIGKGQLRESAGIPPAGGHEPGRPPTTPPAPPSSPGNGQPLEGEQSVGSAPERSRTGTPENTESLQENGTGGGKKWLLLVVGLCVLLLLGGGAALWFGRGAREDEPAKKREKSKRKKRSVPGDDDG